MSIRRLIDPLLRLPLFYKVLLANSALVGFGTIVGTWLVASHARSHPGESSLQLIAALAAAGLVLSIGLNAAVLKAAFSPLRTLSETTDEVRRGNFGARAHHVIFTDPQIERLTDTLNAMLDAVESYRRQVQMLSSQAISAQEEERKRIARELHDDTAQVLTSLLIRLRVAENSGNLEAMKLSIAEIRELAGDTLDSVRKLALELRPSALDDLGLVPALQWYTAQYSDRFPIRVKFRADGFERRLPPDVEVVLYRVVQEALTNVAKHARARSANVTLEIRYGVVVGTIEDDGRGFDVAAALKSRDRGLGLFGMQERIVLVGGKLRLDSRPGAGTRVSIEIPVPPDVPTSEPALDQDDSQANRPAAARESP